ncbi:hypothetical protein NSMM_880028 [Nitrosomonas mobilis]|uniref:Uncharacterized protein n=1 Tax=Nitrosomonas mobilis TaxID=51642 RepID=A0A1G5SIV7_9PROT|nr:hypothetical protein NSMM_880028 [Nitrosomonas mobilis]
MVALLEVLQPRELIMKNGIADEIKCILHIDALNFMLSD